MSDGTPSGAPPQEKRRDVRFSERVRTRICLEHPTASNPYVAEAVYFHGYDLIELMHGRSWCDVLYLLLRGELPDPDQSHLLERLFVALSNPGPRHPATRAAMNAGIGKTDTAHLLPIALATLGGEHLGGAEVTAAMRFIGRHTTSDARQVATDLPCGADTGTDGDAHPAPGFGSRFGAIDVMSKRTAEVLAASPGSGNALRWGAAFATALEPRAMGWLMTGVAAAALLDLGFQPRAGAGLFQLACAPGLLAHGLEMSNKPITAMPFIDDSHYVIEDRRHD